MFILHFLNLFFQFFGSFCNPESIINQSHFSLPCHSPQKRLPAPAVWRARRKNQGCGPVSASTGTRRQAMTVPKSNDLEQLKQPLNSKRQSYPKQSQTVKLISQLHIPIKKCCIMLHCKLHKKQRWSLWRNAKDGVLCFPLKTDQRYLIMCQSYYRHVMSHKPPLLLGDMSVVWDLNHNLLAGCNPICGQAPNIPFTFHEIPILDSQISEIPPFKSLFNVLLFLSAFES